VLRICQLAPGMSVYTPTSRFKLNLKHCADCGGGGCLIPKLQLDFNRRDLATGSCQFPGAFQLSQLS